MMANSRRARGKHESKRRYSPSDCQRSASSGECRTARNGPMTVPRGPATTLSYTRRWASVSDSSEIGGMRGKQLLRQDFFDERSDDSAPLQIALCVGVDAELFEHFGGM